MNRLLLALLALFAGLAAQSAPAQARAVGDAAQINTAENCRNARPSPSPRVEPVSPVLRQARRDRTAVSSRPKGLRITVPTVLFGSDRAFE